MQNNSDSLSYNIANAIIATLKENNSDYITSEVENFVVTVSDLVELYTKKNHDYGNSFVNAYEKFGNLYPLTRIYDKYSRLETLCNSGIQLVKDESIKDTLHDLACYSIMFSNVL